ncbi:MAG: single-stranded DNA-binding protein [Thermoproteota archaeon]
MSEFDALLGKLLEQKPELSRTDVEEKIKQKKEKIGAGYLTDQGALFLIAADLGVILEQPAKVEIGIRDLHVGAKEVTLDTRILSISPSKQFSRKDGTTFFLRTMTVYDSDSTASVKLWDEKANLPVINELKPGDLVKIVKAYVKSDLNGAPTLNIGSGSDIEVINKQTNIPSLESITKDVSSLKENEKDIVVSGKIDGNISLMEYTNSQGQLRKALRFRLKGNNGNFVKVVLWGKDESSLPKMIPSNAKVRLLGMKTKSGNQGIELHGNDVTVIEIEGKKEAEPVVARILSIAKNESGNNLILVVDKNKSIFKIFDQANIIGSYNEMDIIELMPSKVIGDSVTLNKDSFVRKIESEKNIPSLSEIRTKISDIKPDNEYCIEAIILKDPQKRQVQTKSGETISLSEMFVEDDSGQIWVKGWRNLARLIDKCSLGEIVSITGVNAKSGLEGRIELFLTQFSSIKKKN